MSFMNIDNSKSYATEEKLLKAIEKRLGDKVSFIVVRNRAGRFTAIFPCGANPGWQPIIFAQQGFLTVN